MAAQTIKLQVESLIGDTSLAPLDDWAGDAINKLVLLLPYDKLSSFTTVSTVTYSGVYTEMATADKRIFQVTRAPSAGSLLNRVCEWITPEEYAGQFSDTASMYYPTDYDPRYTFYEA